MINFFVLDLNTTTDDLIEPRSKIQIIEEEKPTEGNICLLKLVSPPELLHTLRVTGVDSFGHIACVTSGRAWVSDGYNCIILTNTKGHTLHRLFNCYNDLLEEGLCNGIHTVNGEGELIYIESNVIIIYKLSQDLKSSTALLKFSDPTWKPMSVYWSNFTRDLLVGMYNGVTETGKVVRYNEAGQLTQTIQHDNTGLDLYRRPLFITVNNNEDVVVSDNDIDTGALVVTDHEGKHRFTYTGHQSESRVLPHGICTDVLSHILVCDDITNTVQMLDKDGRFLSLLQTISQEMNNPRSLSYDVNTHCIWVGSQNENKLCVYRHLTHQNDQTCKTNLSFYHFLINLVLTYKIGVNHLSVLEICLSAIVTENRPMLIIENYLVLKGLSTLHKRTNYF